MSCKPSSLAEQHERPWRLTMSVVLLLAITLALGACNTMRGLGQDVGAAGQTVEETAEDVQN